MCTVQVLLFADVMGRANSAQGVRSGAGVCRRLFANDSSERADPSVFLKRMEEQLRQREKDRWNFDFQTETPLPGRYQWTAVGAPAPMRIETTVVAETSKPSQSSSLSMQASKRKRSNVATQPKITEFMTKRKRPSPVPTEGKAHKLKVRRLNMSSDRHTASTMPR